MGTLFSALDIGRAGLLVAQVQLDVAGHNIANVNKEGFSRQRVEVTTRVPNYRPFGAIGRGPKIEGVQRVRDAFLDDVYRKQVPGLGSAEVQSTFFSRLEDLFQEPGVGGFGSRLDTFFDALNDLANNVEELPVRVALLGETNAIAGTLRGAAQRIRDLRGNANQEVRNYVPGINSLSERIAALNIAVRDAELNGRKANDLRDDRDVLIDELATLVNINYRERDNGVVDIQLGGAQLVNGGHFNALETYPDPAIDPDRPDFLGIRFADTGEEAHITNGRLFGAIQARDVEIKAIKDRLDDLAAALIKGINDIHTQGNGLSYINEAIASTNSVLNVNAPFRDNIAELPFPVVEGSFDLNVYDETTDPPALVETINVPIITSGPTFGWTNIGDIENFVNSSAFLSSLADGNGILNIIPDAGYSFSFANDTSGVLTAIGLNGLLTGSDAASINVNQDIEDHPEWLSTGFSLDPLNTGDNTAALAMASVRDAALLDNESQSINEYFESTVVDIGIRSRSNLDTFDVQLAFVQDFARRRQEVSGVSLDEEATFLIQYQRAFEASARVISVTDRMLDTLVNLVR